MYISIRTIPLYGLSMPIVIKLRLTLRIQKHIDLCFSSGDQLLHETTDRELWPPGVHHEHILLHQTLCHWLQGCTEMAEKGDGLVHVHVCLTNLLQSTKYTYDFECWLNKEYE